MARGRGRPRGSRNVSGHQAHHHHDGGSNDGESNHEAEAVTEAADSISRGDQGSLFSQTMKAGINAAGRATSANASYLAITKIVESWCVEYEHSRSDGLQRIIQFIMHATGCKGIADKSLYESDVGAGFSNLITRMVEQFDEDTADYPFIMNALAYRRFRQSFCDFIVIMVKQCQRDIIYDAYLMDNVIQLLTEMCNSKVRAFRHTAAICSMKLMTALVRVALTLHGNLNQTTKQINLEQQKTSKQRATKKMQALQSRQKELEDQSSEIEDMLNSIFKGIFAHRYRDVVPDIRATCMEEIGNWMRIFPKVFLTDSYLKYVGWTLNDKIKEVRICCVKTLINLYKDVELCKELSLFTKRFKTRLNSMTADKDQECAVLATKLCTFIVQHFRDEVFTREECENVYMLVFSSHRPLSAAAADFLWEKIFAPEESKNEPQYTKRGKRRSRNAPLIQILVYFYIESELHEHTRYLVDSLWDSKAAQMLRDWPAMTDILLEEPARENDILEPNAELALIDLILSTVVQAAKGQPPGRTGSATKKSTMTAKEKSKQEADIQKLTEHFIQDLPKLITKYQADPERLNLLLQIPRYFNLELYALNRQDIALETLLRQLANVIQLNIQDDVLENCSRIFELFCSNDDELFYIAQRARLQRDVSAERISQNFHSALDDYRTSMAYNRSVNDTTMLGDDGTPAYSALMWLKRFAWMSIYNDIIEQSSVNGQNIADTCIELLKSQRNAINTSMASNAHDPQANIPMPEEILIEACRILHSDLQAQLVALLKSIEEPDGGVLRHLATRFRDVVDLFRFCMSQKHESLSKLREFSYTSVCDLMQYYSYSLVDHTDNEMYDRGCLKELVYDAPPEMTTELIEFVRARCFLDTEGEDKKLMKESMRNDDEVAAKIEAVHRRRQLLAGFCKLVVYRRIAMKLAAPVFGHYMRAFSDYGDVIRHTISKCREINQVDLARTLAVSLIKLFKDLRETPDSSIDKSSSEYTHLKELARRFSLTFGLEQIRIRDAIASLHKEGMDFALQGWPQQDRNTGQLYTNDPPYNIAFLDILLEFSSKLMRQDRRVVMEYLRSLVEVGHNAHTVWDHQESEWVPLMTYRNSLTQGADDPPTRRGKKDAAVTRAEEEELMIPPSPFRAPDPDETVGFNDQTTVGPNGLSTPIAQSTALNVLEMRE